MRKVDARRLEDRFRGTVKFLQRIGIKLAIFFLQEKDIYNSNGIAETSGDDGVGCLCRETRLT
jgi:hypothetical protein